MISKKPRKSGLDAVRLLSALAVICTHANRFEGTTHMGAALLTKWSVAFFFIVLGYFLGKKTDLQRTTPALKRIFVMFLVASALMLPLSVVRTGVSETWAYACEHFLINGTYFHLWYLNSLLLGLLVIRLTDPPQRQRLLPIIAGVAMIASLALGTYGTEDTRFFGRHLMSIPLLWFGMLLSKGVPSVRLSSALVLLGLALEVVESQIVHALLGKEAWQCPFFVGTLPLTVGLFGVAFHLPQSPRLEALGNLGSRYTGTIYVTHPYFIALVVTVAGAAGLLRSLAFHVVEVPLIFLLNLGTLWLLDRLMPSAIDLVLGDASVLGRWWRYLASFPKSALRTARALAFTRA